MQTVLDVTGFINQWETAEGYTAGIIPVNYDDRPEVPWDYCDVWYSVLPTRGRHLYARYRIELALSSGPPDTKSDVRETSATTVLPLDVWGPEPRSYVHLRGLSPEDRSVVECLQKRTALEATVDDTDAFDYLVVRLDYLADRSRDELTGFDSVESAREQFVALVEEGNEYAGVEIDPSESYF
jgi:hypothetical protein